MESIGPKARKILLNLKNRKARLPKGILRDRYVMMLERLAEPTGRCWAW